VRAESMWIAAWHQQTNGSERSHEAGLPGRRAVAGPSQRFGERTKV
jgi:hypothetical protein